LNRITVTESDEVIYNSADSFTHVYLADKDMKKLAQDLGKIKIVDWNVPNDSDQYEELLKQSKDTLRDIKKKMSQGKPFKELLRHKFFQPLQEVPVKIEIKEEDQTEFKQRTRYNVLY
jgi:hypothetical protein